MPRQNVLRVSAILVAALTVTGSAGCGNGSYQGLGGSGAASPSGSSAGNPTGGSAGNPAGGSAGNPAGTSGSAVMVSGSTSGSASSPGPGCIGSPGLPCGPYSEGTMCPGGPAVCVQCGAGVYSPSSSFCSCTSGTWVCAPPAAGEIQCPDPVPNADFYIDPACSTPYEGSAPIGALPDGGSSEAGTDADLGDGGTCNPAPGSCDAPSPKMFPLDQQRNCFGAPTLLTGVCDTSINRCTPLAGLGPLCAFAPDGGIFVSITSDNDVLTAVGWQFTEAPIAVVIPIPSDQLATAAEEDECMKAQCAPPCPGVQPNSFGFLCEQHGEDAGGD